MRASRVDPRDERVGFRKLCRAADAERRSGHTESGDRRMPREALASFGVDRDDESRSRRHARGTTGCFARLSIDQERRRSRLERRSLCFRASIVTASGAIVATRASIRAAWASLAGRWASIVTPRGAPERDSVAGCVPNTVSRTRPHTRKVTGESLFPHRARATMARVPSSLRRLYLFRGSTGLAPPSGTDGMGCLA